MVRSSGAAQTKLREATPLGPRACRLHAIGYSSVPSAAIKHVVAAAAPHVHSIVPLPSINGAFGTIATLVIERVGLSGRLRKKLRLLAG